MPALQSVKIRYDFSKEYPGTWKTRGVGAQAASYRRGFYPQMPVLAGGSAEGKALCRLKKWLYIGGDFTTVGGETGFLNLCRVNLEDGVVDSTFKPQFNGQVVALETDGTKLYVGGAFTTVDGISRGRAMRYAASGVIDNWDPQFNGTVLGFAVRTGSTSVFVAGQFTSSGSDARAYLAEIDNSGIATLFDASVDATVYCVAYDLSQDKVYIGGDFANAGGSARTRVAKIDADTAVADSWNPTANATVSALVVDYPLIYIGGFFTNAGGSARTRVACIDQAGVATSFAPSISNLGVLSIGLMGSGSDLKVFVGGSFTGVLAGFKASDSSALSWNPAPTCSNGISKVLCYKNSVFVAGDPSAINGIGATTTTVQGAATISYPLFRDDNTIFVKKTGLFDDAGAGTYADPKRSIRGAIGTTPTFNDQSSAGNNLTETGSVTKAWRTWAAPIKGDWMAGLFNDSNYLSIPAAVGTAWAASNALTAGFAFFLDSLSAINTIWDWQNGTGEVIVSVGTSGQLNFDIHGTTASSSNGIIRAGKWYIAYVEKNPSGNLKRAWLAEPGQKPQLVINTTQAATFGANTSNRLGRDRATGSRFLTGFLGPVIMFDSAYISSLSSFNLPLDWRDSYSANCKGYWPMQTKSVAEGDTDLRYVCILDSETYEEAFNWHVEGSSLYAKDGCRPVIAPRVGAKPGTYGARLSGREKFSTGAAGTFLYVSKAGNDSTGTRGDQTKPFLTISAAISAASASDTIQIEDSGVYVESLNSTNALIIQAADGEIPVLKQAVTSTAGIQGKISLYGVFVRSLSGSYTYAPTVGINVYDCTFSGITLSFAVIAVTSTIKNCAGVAITNAQVGNGTGSTIYSENNQGTFSTSCTGSSTNVLTGTNSFHLQNSYTSQTFSFSSSSGSGTQINGTRHVFDLCKIGTGSASASGNPADTFTSNSVFFSRCLFTTATTSSLAFSATGNVGGSTSYLMLFSVAESLFSSTSANTSSSFSINISSTTNITLTRGYFSISNCAMFGSSALVGCNISVGSGQSGAYIKALNDTGVNFGEKNFVFTNTGGNYEVSGLVGKGASVSDLSSSASLTVTYCSADVVAGSVTGATDEDPLLLSSVDGSVNVGLSALSPCVFTGDSEGILDRGANWAWVKNQAPGAVISGLVFSGSLNFGAGLENLNGVQTLAESCTFDGLGLGGFIMRDGSSAEWCEGAETNGPAFRVGGPSSSLSNCIAWACAGTAFLYGSTNLEDAHNSSWGCEFGHYDITNANGILQNSIHSDNGVDVVANEAVAYSAVGTVDDDTVVSSTSIRKNPLFVDPYTGDLSLKTIEGGYRYSSPAKGVASDSSDMGAYEAEYGCLFEPFVELDMKAHPTRAAADGGPWRNPDSIPEERVTVKLSEGEKPLGGFYSNGKGTKRVWTLNWQSTNPMPQDQLIALNEVYACSGRVCLFLDGKEWIDVVVVKSNTAKNNQIDELYTNSDVPRPLASLQLREA